MLVARQVGKTALTIVLAVILFVILANIGGVLLELGRYIGYKISCLFQ